VSDDKLVLVVDDCEDTRSMLVEFLTLSGFTAVEAATGRDALVQARAHKPAFVVLDISLPDMDGREVARALRADPEVPRAFVLAVTGYTSDEAVEGARNSGCDAFVAKPCAPDALVEMMMALSHGHAAAKKK
jgi:two-component system, cell cycle response regulator DivK